MQVEGASSHEDAVKISKSIVKSSLVKTAIYGEDANWARILCAKDTQRRILIGQSEPLY